MTNNEIQIKIKERLNKLASFDYDNIECWQIQEAFNKSQLEWARRVIHGYTQKKETPEQGITGLDDLQILLTQASLSDFDRGIYSETETLPNNYLHYVRTTATGKSECCPDRTITVYLAEEANVDDLLTDSFKSPNFEWAETFCTVMGGRVRIYTDKKFIVTGVKLVYYRKPTPIAFAGCINLSTGDSNPKDITCEFNEDVTEILVDNAAMILAGDIENITQYQRQQQNVQLNT
jgi:hypothetical protein